MGVTVATVGVLEEDPDIVLRIHILVRSSWGYADPEQFAAVGTYMTAELKIYRGSLNSMR